MRKKKRWRYYCAHCGKVGGHAGWMRRHEASCTLNLDRVCGMCERVGIKQQNIANLNAALLEDIRAAPYFGYDKQVEPTQLRELSQGCPMCMLAAIRQDTETEDDWSFRGDNDSINFWFEGERDTFLENFNRREAAKCHHG